MSDRSEFFCIKCGGYTDPQYINDEGLCFICEDQVETRAQLEARNFPEKMKIPFALECVKLASEMLEGEVPASLVTRLIKAEELVNKCGGSIKSRQTVAAIVEQWLRDREQFTE